MKTLIAALVAVGCLYAFEACGQSQNAVGPDPLPPSLPIGSLQQMLEYAVTNQACEVVFNLKYQDASNNYHQVGISGTGIHFSSYAAFRQCLLTNSMALLVRLKAATNVVSTISYESWISYDKIDTITALSIFTDIGPVGGITSNTFACLQPGYEVMAMPIAGLQGMTIQVQCGGNGMNNYTNVWTPTTGWSTSAPQGEIQEFGGVNLVVLNNWYSTNGYDTRFTLTAAGETRTYTGLGKALAPAVLEPPQGAQINLALTPGADTDVQMSTNLINWTTIASFPWSCGITNAAVTIDESLPKAFFRTSSQ